MDLKSFELQRQIRDNAEDLKSFVNDFADWEKEMAVKEAKLLSKEEDVGSRGEDKPPKRDAEKVMENSKERAKAKEISSKDKSSKTITKINSGQAKTKLKEPDRSEPDGKGESAKTVEGIGNEGEKRGKKKEDTERKVSYTGTRPKINAGTVGNMKIEPHKRSKKPLIEVKIRDAKCFSESPH